MVMNDRAVSFFLFSFFFLFLCLLWGLVGLLLLLLRTRGLGCWVLEYLIWKLDIMVWWSYVASYVNAAYPHS